MVNLIIDATGEKIFLKIIKINKSYTSEYSNNRENFDRLALLIFNFINKSGLKIKQLDNIFVNQGPGRFAGIRSSISVCKGISMLERVNIYGFNSDQVIKKNYNKILDLFQKGVLIRNLIKPQYK